MKFITSDLFLEFIELFRHVCWCILMMMYFGLPWYFWDRDNFLSLSSFSRGSSSKYICKRQRPRQHTPTVCCFMQNHWHYTVSHFSKCFLVASWPLDHFHSVNIIRARGCEIMPAAVAFFWCSLASYDILVLFRHPSTEERSQGRRSRGWLCTSLIFNGLFYETMIIWENCAWSD